MQNKLRYDTGLAGLTLDDYEQLLAARLATAASPEERRLLQKLSDWPVESGLARLVAAR